MVTKRSPSSRRAWIEIWERWKIHHGCQVALLAEGVDRNCIVDAKSPCRVAVALLAEGVDRNLKKLW